VEEPNLNKNVSLLRKALGESATGQTYIETVPRVGHRFVAPVSRFGSRSVTPAQGRSNFALAVTVFGWPAQAPVPDIPW